MRSEGKFLPRLGLCSLGNRQKYCGLIPVKICEFIGLQIMGGTWMALSRRRTGRNARNWVGVIAGARYRNTHERPMIESSACDASFGSFADRLGVLNLSCHHRLEEFPCHLLRDPNLIVL